MSDEKQVSCKSKLETLFSDSAMCALVLSRCYTDDSRTPEILSYLILSSKKMYDCLCCWKQFPCDCCKDEKKNLVTCEHYTVCRYGYCYDCSVVEPALGGCHFGGPEQRACVCCGRKPDAYPCTDEDTPFTDEDTDEDTN